MSKIAVVYWSMGGHTETMANAVAEAAGVEAMTVADFDTSSVDDYDVLAFGCPAMGAENLEEGEVQPMWDEVKDALAGKKVALFGSYGWGDGEWMRTWQEEAEEAGADMVADGLAIQEDTDEAEVTAACAGLGEKLAA